MCPMPIDTRSRIPLQTIDLDWQEWRKLWLEVTADEIRHSWLHGREWLLDNSAFHDAGARITIPDCGPPPPRAGALH